MAAPEPASVSQVEVEVRTDFGEMHVTSGTHREGVYFNPRSRLVQRFVDATEAVRKRAKFLRTPFWARNGHVNTVVGHMFRGGSRSHPGEGYDRLFLKCDDGGTLSVDLTKTDNIAATSDADPFVLMIAGLGGSSADPYTQAMTSACARRGWRSAVICMRGTGNGPVTSGRLFSARRGSTDDVRHVMADLRARGVIKDSQPIFGVGWSLGGCIMSNTVLDQDEMSPGSVRISAAAALGAPYDLHQSSELLKPFPNWVYSYRMAQGLVNILRPIAHNFDNVRRNFLGEENFKFDAELAYKSKSILDFDEALTAPFFGFGSAKEYYDYSSPGKRFSATSPSVPFACVSALDDPVVGNEGIPFEAARENENMVVVATEGGGHLGWCQSLGLGCGYAKDPSQNSWTEDLVLDFFETALKNK